MSALPNPVDAPAHILSLLDRLHAESSAQEAELGNYLSETYLGQPGKVIATENESTKIKKAREYWHEAGRQVEGQIELREGDLRETLAADLPTVDLLLIDIWAPLALPALKLVEHKLRPGAVIIIDNSISSAARYADLFDYLRGPGHGFISLTIPYSKGLELVIKM